MKKILNRFFKIFSITILGLLLLFSLLLAGLQTKWSKEKIRDAIVQSAKENGIALTIGSIKGQPPFKWTLENVQIQFSDSNALDIEKISLRLGLWNLANKHISISYLKLHGAHLTCQEGKHEDGLLISKEQLGEVLSSLSFPFSLTIKSVKANPIVVTNLTSNESAPYYLEGNLRLGQRAKYFSGSIRCSSILYPTAEAKVFVQASLAKDEAEVRLSLNLPTAHALAPFATIKAHLNLSVYGSMVGPWHTWRTLVGLGKDKSTNPLNGECKVLVSELDMQGLPELNQKWKMKSVFSLHSNGTCKLNDFLVQSDLCRCKGRAVFSKDFELQNLNAALSLKSVSLLERFANIPLEGSLRAKVKITEREAEINIYAEDLKIEHALIDNLAGTIYAKKEQNEWDGDAFFQADKSVLPFDLSSQFSFTKDTSLILNGFFLSTTGTKVTGNLNWNFPLKTFSGDLYVFSQDLKPWAKAFPAYPLEGSLGMSLQLLNDNVTARGNVKNFRCRDLFADKIEIDAKILDIFKEIKGDVSLAALGLVRPPFEIYTLDFSTKSEDKAWPFTFAFSGSWKEYLHIETAGVFVKDKESYELLLNDITGTMLGKNIHLESPFSLFYSPTAFRLNNCAILLDGGRFFTDITLSQEVARIELTADRFPIDLLALSTPYFSLNGTSSINALLEGTPSHLEGRASLLLEEATLVPIGKKKPLEAKGQLALNIHDKTLQLHAFVKTTKEQFLDASATLPIDYKFLPFELHIDKDRNLSGELTMEGRLEEIFDFVNIGSHGATGWISSHLFLSKNLSSPVLQGEIELQDGTYENYYTGTLLKEIDAHAFAEKGKIILGSFHAEDGQEGSVHAHGEFLLDPKYNYHLHFELDNLNCVRFDSLNANLTGPLDVTGNKSSALGKGSLLLSKAELNIPDELPQDIPVLPVVYINQPVTLSSVTATQASTFPFKLDLDLSAPGKVFLNGNGLHSEWQGDVHLTGINTSFLASGKLSLLKGEFVFSGKVFNLTNGEMVFSDKPTQSAFLNLTGTLNIGSYTITAYLRGPLSSPQITFQSNPHLPTSSILSYILFNKDVSEISPIQAIQLAQMIVTLSGKAGPDILETIRKTLGVDRLTIASSQDSDEITVQIGKYLTKGLMITLAQSATSSNIIVEVELAKGFILQAETQEDEQGKFTIKWNRNY